jgi:hypothetical protein
MGVVIAGLTFNRRSPIDLWRCAPLFIWFVVAVTAARRWLLSRCPFCGERFYLAGPGAPSSKLPRIFSSRCAHCGKKA